MPFRLESSLKMCQSDIMKIKGLRSYLWCGVVCYGAILPEHLVIHVSTGVFPANYIELVCVGWLSCTNYSGDWLCM